MFGFMRPSLQSLRYRSIYAQCCQNMRTHYGAFSLPFHSFESVFIYSACLDAGFIPAQSIPSRHCCHIRANNKNSFHTNEPIGKYCASMALLLGNVKLEDDIRDERLIYAKLVRFLLRIKINKSYKYFHQAAPGLLERLQRHIDEHLMFETRRPAPKIDEYVTPTADAFSVLFSTLPDILGYKEYHDIFASIGCHLGSAIIAFDCAVDWQKDKSNQSHNPIAGHTEEHHAFLAAIFHLEAVHALCLNEFGESSLSAEIASSVLDGIRNIAKSRSAITRDNQTIYASAAPATLYSFLIPFFIPMLSSPYRHTKNCCCGSHHTYYDNDDECCGKETHVKTTTPPRVGTDCCGNTTYTYDDGCCSTTVTEKTNCCGGKTYEKSGGC